MKKLFHDFCVIFELICSCLLILVSVHSFFFPEEPATEYEIYYPAYEGAVISADSLVLNDSLMQVSVYDQGLEMWQGSYRLHREWHMRHDVATDTLQEDHYNKFNLSFHGPEGEIIKSLGYNLYDQLGSREPPKSFEDEWQAKIRQGLSDYLNSYQLGKLQETDWTSINYLVSYLPTDSTCQYLQVPIRGQKDGQAYEGIVRIIKISPELNWLNNFCMSVTLCPAGLLQQTLETEAKIAESYAANPAFVLAKDRQQEAYLQGSSVFASSMNLK